MYSVSKMLVNCVFSPSINPFLSICRRIWTSQSWCTHWSYWGMPCLSRMKSRYVDILLHITVIFIFWFLSQKNRRHKKKQKNLFYYLSKKEIFCEVFIFCANFVQHYLIKATGLPGEPFKKVLAFFLAKKPFFLSFLGKTFF